MLQNRLANASIILAIFVCQSAIANTKTNTFTDNNNGTISDVATGLMWQKQDDNVPRLHAAAISYCGALMLAGKSDWRLPSLKELSSIVDYRIDNPSIDTSVFPNTNLSPYWSNANRESSSNSAWVVLFDEGRVTSSSKTGNDPDGSPDVFVRCVRTAD